MCANCSKAKSHHPVASIPQPAKRQSKATALQESQGEPDSEDDTSDSRKSFRQNTGDDQIGGDVRRVVPAKVESDRMMKPAPLKAKPSIGGARPDKPRKPNFAGDAVTANPIPAASPKRLVVSDMSPTHEHKAGERGGKACENQKSSSKYDQGLISMKSRLQGTPPPCQHDQLITGIEESQQPGQDVHTGIEESQLPGQDVHTGSDSGSDKIGYLRSNSSINSTASNYTNLPSNGDKKPESRIMPQKVTSTGTPIYQVYDVSAKGMSGMPDPVDHFEQSPLVVQSPIQSLDRRDVRKGAVRMVEVEEQTVAMPYTVVDVTTCPPFAKERIDTGQLPPKLPSTPAPEKAASRSASPGMDVGNKPLPAKRDFKNVGQICSPTPKHRLFSNSSHEPVPDEEVYGAAGESEVSVKMAGKTELVRPDYKSPAPLRKPLFLNRVYEDIDESSMMPDTSRPAANEFVRQTSARSSATKSSAFEAKVAALSGLDLGKTVSLKTPPAVMMDSDSMREPLVAADEKMSGSEVISGKKDLVPTGTSKQEKTKKSGGKTFFQKLLKFGSSKETIVEPPTAVPAAIEESTQKSSVHKAEMLVENSVKTCAADDTPLSPSVVHRAPVIKEREAILSEVKDRLAKRQQVVVSGVLDATLIHVVQSPFIGQKMDTVKETDDQNLYDLAAPMPDIISSQQPEMEIETRQSPRINSPKPAPLARSTPSGTVALNNMETLVLDLDKIENKGRDMLVSPPVFLTNETPDTSGQRPQHESELPEVSSPTSTPDSPLSTPLHVNTDAQPADFSTEQMISPSVMMVSPTSASEMSSDNDGSTNIRRSKSKSDVKPCEFYFKMSLIYYYNIFNCFMNIGEYTP